MCLFVCFASVFQTVNYNSWHPSAVHLFNRWFKKVAAEQYDCSRALKRRTAASQATDLRRGEEERGKIIPLWNILWSYNKRMKQRPPRNPHCSVLHIHLFHFLSENTEGESYPALFLTSHALQVEWHCVFCWRETLKLGHNGQSRCDKSYWKLTEGWSFFSVPKTKLAGVTAFWRLQSVHFDLVWNIWSRFLHNVPFWKRSCSDN